MNGVPNITDSDIDFVSGNDCSILDSKSIKSYFQNKGNKFSILNLNIRSLPKHYDEINLFLSRLNHSFKIIVLTETWLSESNKDDYPLPGYTGFHLVRSNKRAGGVSVYVINEFNSIKVMGQTGIFHIANSYF